MNVGTRGVSWSLGPRGASINVSRRGTYLNTGIPGTGLSSRERISGPTRSYREQPSRREGAAISTRKVTGKVTEEGLLALAYEDGTALSPEHQTLCLKQNKQTLLDFLQREAEERISSLEALATLHEKMPDARKPLRYKGEPFAEEPPIRPVDLPPKPYGLLDRLVKAWRVRVDEENERRQTDNANALSRWQAEVDATESRKRAYEREQSRLRQLFEEDVRTDTDAMAKVLELRLQSIEWPRETQVSFDLRDAGKVILLDVDLPEIEDMPTHTCAVLKRDMMLTKKELSEKRVRELYMRHVHAVGLRLLGEVFATLPACERAVLSAYSQRPSKQTGQTGDEYLYSVRVSRDQWLKLKFEDLTQVDPVEALDAFEARRTMTKSGIFTAIEPFAN